MCIFFRIEDARREIPGKNIENSIEWPPAQETGTHLCRNDQEMEEVKSGRKRREFDEEDAIFAREYSDPNHPKCVLGRIKRRRLGSGSQRQDATSTCESAEEARDRWCTEDNVWHIWSAISFTKWDTTGSFRESWHAGERRNTCQPDGSARTSVKTCKDPSTSEKAGDGLPEEEVSHCLGWGGVAGDVI